MYQCFRKWGSVFLSSFSFFSIPPIHPLLQPLFSLPLRGEGGRIDMYHSEEESMGDVVVHTKWGESIARKMLTRFSLPHLVIIQDALEYRRKMRLLKVRMLDGTVKAVMVDDSQTVANLMVIICAKIGITNHEEYSLVWDKPRDEADEAAAAAHAQSSTNKFGTLGGTMTLRGKTRTYRDGEKEIDPKMEELKRQLNTEDGVNWVDHGKTLREQGIVETDVLLLKRKYFYSDANIDSRDPVQLNLLYEQAREAIVDGTHPVRLEDAVEFAALQVQIQFGDHREANHRPGILE